MNDLGTYTVTDKLGAYTVTGERSRSVQTLVAEVDYWNKAHAEVTAKLREVSRQLEELQQPVEVRQ